MVLALGRGVRRNKAGSLRVGQDDAHSLEHVVGPIAQGDPEGDFAWRRSGLPNVECHERRPAAPAHLQRRGCHGTAHIRRHHRLFAEWHVLGHPRFDREGSLRVSLNRVQRLLIIANRELHGAAMAKPGAGHFHLFAGVGSAPDRDLRPLLEHHVVAEEAVRLDGRRGPAGIAQHAK